MNLIDRAARIAAAARVAEDADWARAQVLAELVGGGATVRAEGSTLARQLAALLDLSRDRDRPEWELGRGLARITETAAEILGVARVGVWFFSADASSLECADRYEAATHAHCSGLVLQRHEFPVYFAALTTAFVLDVSDLRGDPRTRELADAWRGVVAALACPVRWRGGLRGVVCCEHVGEPRTWRDDEQTFVASIADAVTLALEADRRRTSERELLQRLAEIEAQRQEIARLTSPVLEVWEGVLAVPITGPLDGARRDALVSTLVEAVLRQRPAWVLLDLGEAGPLDAGAALALSQIVHMLWRLGAGCVLSGVDAESLAALGMHGAELSRLHTANSLKAALRLCLQG